VDMDLQRRGAGRMVMKRVAAVGVLLAVQGCGERTVPEPGSLQGPWVADTVMTADTVTVSTVSGSEWGEARLIEELRIGGVEGEPHERFGQVGGLAVTTDGHVLVYDAHETALRRYDGSGQFQGTIGRSGSGPGEYQNVAGLGVLEDGRIVVNDFGNGRFNVYASDGGLDGTWSVRPAIAARRPLHPHPEGGVFLHDVDVSTSPPAQVLVRLDRDGERLDASAIPYTDYRSPSLQAQAGQMSISTALPFSASSGWSVTSDGHLVAWLGERYAVDVHRNDGTVLRIARDIDPVPVTADEQAAEEARVRAFFERSVDGWRWDGPPIPDRKPPISWVHTGRDGTIWVRIATPGTPLPDEDRTTGMRSWVDEPIVFDVFESEGRLLGQVQAPSGMRLEPHPIFDRDEVWAVVVDDLGVESVARLRVHRD
jgi:hypothetical protein